MHLKKRHGPVGQHSLSCQSSFHCALIIRSNLNAKHFLQSETNGMFCFGFWLLCVCWPCIGCKAKYVKQQ